MDPWGSICLPKVHQHVHLCSCSRGNVPLLHREIWHFHHCHVLCSDSGVRATALQQCPTAHLRKGAVKYTTNPKPPLPPCTQPPAAEWRITGLRPDSLLQGADVTRASEYTADEQQVLTLQETLLSSEQGTGMDNTALLGPA